MPDHRGLDQPGLRARPRSRSRRTLHQWKCKVRAKTASAALSEEQFQALNQAIRNWKEAEQILGQLQSLKRQFMFGTLPDTRRRKRLTMRVLGIN